MRKMRLTTKFMKSQPGLQKITIHIFANISRTKGNQTMKHGQLTEYNKGNIFPQNAENESGRLVPVPFYFF